LLNLHSLSLRAWPAIA